MTTTLDPALSIAFVHAHARPLDAARLAHRVEGASPAGVASALTAYQNPDGGFGHALEPDFRLQGSSAMATTFACDYLARIDASADHPLVAGLLRWLHESFNPEVCGWEIVPEAVNDVPRAFWWNWEGPPTAWPGNPSADALAALYRWAPNSPLVAPVARAALASLDRPEMEWHEVLCWTRLLEAAPMAFAAAAHPRVEGFVVQVACLDPQGWDAYAPRPHLFAPHPGARFHAIVAAGLEADLDRMIAERDPDGGWSPPWTWGRYEEVWPEAQRDWRGHLAMKHLEILAAYGRLSG